MPRYCRIILVSFLLAACSTAPGDKNSHFDPSQLAKADIDRISEVHRAQLDASLKVLAEKLYRRNPREWRNAGQPNLEAAIARIFAAPNYRLPELGTRTGTDAIVLGLQADYKGDRVAAFVAGMGSMIDTTFNGKREFYMYDSLDPQHLYNAARNIEIAAWKLANSRDEEGRLLLLSNDMASIQNLSFEREFGRMIGNLDLLSEIIAGKTNRTVVKIVQSLATAVFLPVGIH
ncbi:MAG TPA: hypothetical protein VL550_03890 [Rhodocyclaceae bacterium]|jgi:hypothetical protein|nr:hypothetical protein [Rhodocyclaceae bacterium]